MCGIAGVVSLGSSEVPSQDVIARMISNLDHRGPDANGVSRFDRCLLGNARLSIIDLILNEGKNAKNFMKFLKEANK